MKEHTPVMRHYLTLKSQYPDALLMYQMGDFYEFFFEDAQRAADILHITLTARGEHASEKIKMAGVPVHTKDSYIHKLIQAGETVVICTQMATTNTTKGLIQREITQIITPGTLTDPHFLDEKTDPILMSICANHPQYFGLAWTSLTRGHVSFRAIPRTACADFLSRIQPHEIVIPHTGIADLPPEYHYTRASADLCHQSLATCLSHVPGYTIHRLFGTQKNHPAAPALACLLAYAQETQRHPPSFITRIEEEQDHTYLFMDARTRRHLDLYDPQDRERPNLYRLLDRCLTKGGSRLLKHRLHYPYRAPQYAQQQQDAIGYLITHLCSHTASHDIRQTLKQLKDGERIATRIALGTVRIQELCALRETLIGIQHIHDIASPILMAQDYLSTLCSAWVIPDLLQETLNKALPEATRIHEHIIAQGYHEALDELRTQYDKQHQALLALEETEKEKTGLHTLRIQYNRIHGYSIELSSGAAKQAPSHYQHVQSLKNVVRFTTPVLQNIEKTILLLREQIQQQEQMLYRELIMACTPYVPTIRTVAESLAQFDLLFSHADWAFQKNYTQPQFTTESLVHIVQGRHPIVESQHTDFIPNDTDSTVTQSFTLITGPNMGGKSTYMRQVALITLMAYCGFYVPADEVKLGPIDGIFTRIGASDDISAGHSTFMMEMIESAYIIQHASQHSLVIMDEIGRGTSTFDGISLAYAIARALIARGCHTFFSTHYQELSQALHHDDSCQHRYFDALIHEERLIFTHHIRHGVSKNSYGIPVARLAGLPNDTLAEAEAFLEQLQHQSVLADTQQRNTVLEAIRDLDITELTPSGALALLHRWKNSLSSAS